MFKIMSAEQAINEIPDGAWIGLNPFLMLSEPFVLHDQIMSRYVATGHPKDINIYAPCGFGVWDGDKLADRYAKQGVLKRVVTSHYTSMPTISRLALEGAIEAYCLPLGVMSHSLRAAAAGRDWLLSKVGLNVYVDPRQNGPGLNSISNDMWVKYVQVEGDEFLYYKTPKIDVALIKGTSVDPVGNICFSDECVTGDALALAQATKRNGGKVIVQVDSVSHTFERPRNVIIPGILVDIVVVVHDWESQADDIKALSGDIHVPSTQMDYWMSQIQDSKGNKAQVGDIAHKIIGRRAAKELRPGDIVNIGIGIPELVGKAASESGVLRDIVLTVESGGIGGLPAPGNLFGATIGADCIVQMSEQFDFYDGGGLSICFMGALEVDRHGNVNVHKLANKIVGIGGFANISSNARAVIFCFTFNAKGLEIEQSPGGAISIISEGEVPKIKDEILEISFSAENALRTGQRVLYVTERCVFKLTEDGLKLAEVFDGIDAQRDIIDQLPFAVI